MITEITHRLTEDQRNTLLFLTGNNKISKSDELSDEEIWNLQEFFGWNKEGQPKLLKLIIKKDIVITKVWM